MTKAGIEISNVSKRFTRGERADSLRDLVAKTLSRRPKTSGRRDFWALENISFAVHPGEAFGIVGPNGAGKSTMLKLLAGIMRPTNGAICVNGRVSALIELGAGFHGDLTGRENIYLNASILGMNRHEVRKKFNEIAAFADIGEFLDTPLKRYSSGMHARLGFAIAAHADPQVLLVDEVLSVGDRVFRSKCLDKMNSFLKQGAAVVFVSHDLGTVNRFCQRAMVLDRGKQLFCGSAADAIGLYYDACSQSLVTRGNGGSDLVQVTNMQVTDSTGRPTTTARPGDRIKFSFDAEFADSMDAPSYGLSLIRTDDHMTMFESSSTRMGWEFDPVHPGDRVRVSYELDLNVGPGQYALGLHVRNRDALNYAVQIAYGEHIWVDSNTTAAGLIHVNPSLEVLPLSAHSNAELVGTKC